MLNAYGLETVFSVNPLDRADHLRRNSQLLEDHLANAGTRILLFSEDRPITDADGNPVWFRRDQIDRSQTQDPVFLGLDTDDVAHWAFWTSRDVAETLTDEAARIKARDLRAAAMKPTADPHGLAVMAQAKAVLGWHRNHPMCSQCGHATEGTHAGYKRTCPKCGAEHFPRTDPVVIMLAVKDEHALIGRGPQLPPGVFTALAGFIEPGETVEDAVARELFEEAGVRATSVRYVASQPWPWVSSLMIGCMAHVDGVELTLDETEVEAARWITRDEAVAALNGTHPNFLLPPKMAIARQLVEQWVREG